MNSFYLFIYFVFVYFQNIKNLDDDALKSLLDEAISYKGPKDKENKSEIFKVCFITNFVFIIVICFFDAIQIKY